MTPLFRIEKLLVSLDSRHGMVSIVDCLSLTVTKGETVALVGESGCGKSVTALAAMGLLEPPVNVTGGEIYLNDKSLLGLSNKELRKIRGRQIAMIFQEPMTSLNPVLTVGEQIRETLIAHETLDTREAERETINLLERVGIPSPKIRAKQYPHEFSGGMKQRVMIAIALAGKPKLLIADEPTTALDSTIQAQILRLLASLKEDLDMSMLLITHNLGLVAQVAQRVVIMYAGQVVEETSVTRLFQSPKHPYTQGLLASLPDASKHQERLPTINGSIPSLANYSSGCQFAERCPHTQTICISEKPPRRRMLDGTITACWLT